QHNTAQHSTAQHSTARYSTATQHSTAQHNTAQNTQEEDQAACVKLLCYRRRSHWSATEPTPRSSHNVMHVHTRLHMHSLTHTHTHTRATLNVTFHGPTTAPPALYQ